MSIRWLVLFATILASLLSPVPATAAVIFDNGAPSGENAAFSDTDPTGQSPFPVQRADNFSLAPGGTTITDVHWFGAYAFTGTPPASDNFTIQIFDNLAAGGPGSLLHTIPVGNVGRVDTGMTIEFTDFTVFSYAAIISPITLSSATTYWLSILNSTTNDPNDNWAWATAVDTGGNSRARFLTMPLPPSWGVPQGVELAFALTDDSSTVPEPSTLLLLGSGLAGVAAWRRRRR